MKQDDEYWMSLALQQAKNAQESAEVPVGCILVDAQGLEVSRQFNRKEMSFNPIAHAEMLSLQEGAEKIKNWRLTGHTLYVTLEPCPMCLAAMVQARISRLVFGAYDAKGGAISLGYKFNSDTRLNHQFSVMGGVQHFECSKILSDFFRSRRQDYPR